jgi:CBS domain containing-hemolysin-like protein
MILKRYPARSCERGTRLIPVCRDSSRKFLGVARAPDLVSALLDKGCIDPTVLETQPLSAREDSAVLNIIEQLRAAAVPLAIVKDSSGRITGVVSPTNLLRTVFASS